MTMFTVLMVAVTVAMASSSTTAAKANKCPCYPLKGRPHYVVCKDSSLKSIPDCVDANVTILSIKTPSIPLVAETFQRFAKFAAFDDSGFKEATYSQGYVKAHEESSNTSKYSRPGWIYIDSEWFMYAPHIKTISIANNDKLSSLAPATFGYLPMLDTVHLNNNKLKSLSQEVFEDTALKTLYLAKNPWLCDCAMATFIQWTRDSGVNIADKTKCAKPKKLKKVNLKDLTLNHACTLPK